MPDWFWRMLGWGRWPCGCWAWLADFLPLHYCPKLPREKAAKNEQEREKDDDWHQRNMNVWYPPL